MKLSLVAIKALSYVHKSESTDYSKYSITTGKIIDKLEYVYILDNVSGLLISEYIYRYLKKCNYVESTSIDGDIIRVKLNEQYFYDLRNKQEI